MPLRPPPVAPARRQCTAVQRLGTPRFLPQDWWQRVHPRFRHLALLLCRHAADADGPNDVLVDDHGQAPFNGDSSRQRADRGPVMRHQGLLKRLAGTLEVIEHGQGRPMAATSRRVLLTRIPDCATLSSAALYSLLSPEVAMGTVISSIDTATTSKRSAAKHLRRSQVNSGEPARY